MGFHNGKYNGKIERWKPYFISGCKLWLDAADESTFYQESGVALWVDKSVGRSSWTSTNGTLNPTFAQRTTLTSSQSVKGTDGWVKVVNTTAIGYHQAGRLNIYGYSDNRSRFTFTYFVPFDSLVEGLYISCANNNGTNYGYIVDDFEKGKIKTFTRINDKRTRNAFGDDFVVGTISGGSQTYAGSTDEVWYVKDYIDEKWDGNSAYQFTSANRPNLQSGGYISFLNGSSEFLDLTSYISKFSGDTEGELFIVGRRTITTQDAQFLSFCSGGTNDNCLLFDHARTDASVLPNDIRIYTADSGGTVHGVGFDYSNTTPDFDILNFRSNGSTWGLGKNGVDLSLTTETSNSGKWFADIGGNFLEIGRRQLASTYYGRCDIKEILYYDHQLTNKERLIVNRYLNAKHSIY